MFDNIRIRIGPLLKKIRWLEEMGENTRTCGSFPMPGPFVFDTPQVQNTANTVYEFKQAFDARPLNIARKKTYTFKTNAERIQYLLGQYAANAASNS